MAIVASLSFTRPPKSSLRRMGDDGRRWEMGEDERLEKIDKMGEDEILQKMGEDRRRWEK